MTRHVALQQELTNYRGENVEANVFGFSLPGFRLQRSEPTPAQGTGELEAPPDLPHLALLARIYHGVEATSCQAERNFSSLSVLISISRASINAFKVEEQIMFLKLNQGCLPEVQSTTRPLRRSKKDAANASRMGNRHNKRRLLRRRWMSKYKILGTKR